MDQRVAIAWTRFGLGPRGTEAPPDDVLSWLDSQITAIDPGPPGPTTPECLLALASDQTLKPPPGQRLVGPLMRAEIDAALSWRLATPLPYRERLVAFWSNHFAISLRAGAPSAVAGAFVREAIRPYVTGRFRDMLLAVMRHPAMLMYLNNAQSVGPHSLAGQRRGLGLNENLARECLELHTLSPAAGYTQQDVTSFAAILTGWSVQVRQEPRGFVFRPNIHEPGSKALMGHTYPEGEIGGVQALDWLASHPATHRHLAQKLARHFIADAPPPEAVRQIEARLRDSKGNLGAAALLIPRLQAAWAPGAKLRSPQDFAIAALRLLDLPPDNRPPLQGLMAGLGQPLWNPPLPNGWPDDAASWAGPEAMLRRIDWCYALAGRAPQADPAALGESALGPLLRPDTMDAIAHAGSRREALALLLASAEFQRR